MTFPIVFIHILNHGILHKALGNIITKIGIDIQYQTMHMNLYLVFLGNKGGRTLSDIQRLNKIIAQTTACITKDAKEMTENELGGRTNQMLEAFSPFDVHFFIVQVLRDKADQSKQEIIKILQGNLESEYAKFEYGAEVGYIHMGAVLGSQESALRLFGLGEYLGLWTVLHPKRMLPFLSDEEANNIAGIGMVTVDTRKIPTLMA
jgi:hypothetical protein